MLIFDYQATFCYPSDFYFTSNVWDKNGEREREREK